MIEVSRDGLFKTPETKALLMLFVAYSELRDAIMRALCTKCGAATSDGK